MSANGKGKISLKDILGDNSSFTDMSKNEKEYFIEILKEEIAKREQSSKPKQIREIIPIEDWINSEYYTGIPPEQIYDYWKNLIVDIFRTDRKPEEKINQLILSGSIGIGKSTAAELAVLRKLYEMSCWENINALYHLMSKTNIMFMYFSVNKIQAERTGYGDIKRLIDSCPYFQQNFKRKSRLDSILAFPEGITVAYGSNENHTIGMSTICSVLDEANFIGNANGPANPERALEMYTSLVNRSNSRFIIDGGVNHSFNILVSSSTTDSSVTERQIAASRDDPHTIICAPSQWEVKPDKFSKKFFYVCKGTDYLEPFIVRSTDDVNNFRISEGLPKSKYVDGIEDFDKIKTEIEKLPPHMQTKFLNVPEDLRQGFETNMLRSLQDIGGVSIGSTGRLFNSVAVYNDCVTEGFHHPFVSESIIISTGDKIEIWDYLKGNFRLKHPERPRFLHIDQSYRTDDTGIAQCYLDEVIEVDGVKKPIFGIDFMIQINPPKPPRKIALYKIRNFVTFLAKRMGVKFGMISYDIFNSEESRQILEEMGLPVRYQSVDRTDKAYLDLVEIMYEGRLRMYDYKIVRSELFNVIHYRDKRKVDHPKTNPDGCFTGDTRVKLYNEDSISFEELYNRYNNSDESFWVYSINKKGEVAPGRAHNVRITKVVDKVLRVYFDNYSYVECTPDHKFLLENGEWVEAQNLRYMDDLKCCKGRKYVLNKIWVDKEVPVYDLEVDTYHNFALEQGCIVHNSVGKKDVADALAGCVENAIQYSIADSESNNGGVEDFIRANDYNTLFEPDCMSADELVDKQIEEMIDEFEMQNTGTLSGLPWMQ